MNSFNGINTNGYNQTGPYVLDSCEDVSAVDRYYPPAGVTAFLFVWKDKKMFIKSTNNYGVPGPRLEYDLKEVKQQSIQPVNDNDRLSKLENTMNMILERLDRNERPMNNKQKGGNRNESVTG
jgi:hypothetical protein